MKTPTRRLFLINFFAFIFSAVLVGNLGAQSFKTLYSFTGNSDGAQPYGGLLLSSNTLYGTTELGFFDDRDYEGGDDAFAVSIEGTSLRVVHEFSGSPFVEAGLVLSNNIFYGASTVGGTSGEGNIFAFHIDGSNFTNLHTFSSVSGSSTNSDGTRPWASLTLSSNTLYGTTIAGGGSGDGSIFSINTDGTSFTNLHNFANIDGSQPFGAMILSSNVLYGTTYEGGLNDSGTIFAINTDGTGFTNLYNFTTLVRSNSDGAGPQCSLVLSGNVLYGTTTKGGTGGNGTLFSIKIDGSGFTNLHSFAIGGRADFYGNLTNSDGAAPYAGLTLFGNTLFGATTTGGAAAAGTLFEIKTDGTGFANLYDFTGENDGANPYGSLIFSTNTLYGTAYNGGSSDYGVVFSLTLPSPPQLAIAQMGANVILSWPTNATVYTLQCSTNAVSTNWTTVSPAPVVIAGQNTVTNAISGTQMFYRLKQ